MVSLLVTAFLPVAILAAFILCKDRAQPEPPQQLLKAFVLGGLSVIPALAFVALLAVLGLVPAAVQTPGQAVLSAFCAAAIPEEGAKLLMLWLLLRRNPWFDERVDGIVYAVCLSLGFAAVENLLYLIDHAEQLMQVGVARALFAIPGHFCDGVLMGYYYSLAAFVARGRIRRRLLTFLAPVLAHGLYDSFLFVADVSELLRGLMLLAFPLFCYLLWRCATRRIRRHLAADMAGCAGRR